MAKKLGIGDKVLFPGFIPHKELFKKLSRTDCFVFPHRYFNYEWAMLESMATGKPIIATDVAATKDILVHGENALLAEPSAKSLLDRIQYFIRNRSRCRKIARNAYTTLKNRHGKDNLKKYEDVIHSL
jgi:glycosyltransferase involved in cell wall biosynthesis